MNMNVQAKFILHSRFAVGLATRLGKFIKVNSRFCSDYLDTLMPFRSRYLPCIIVINEWERKATYGQIQRKLRMIIIKVRLNLLRYSVQQK